ncbi:hypothetical protein WJX81_002965 [Elliptochloris bilobata]|uniref:Fluoride ion transporter CrcB n=1 Tax=Elliptochloris bilobata TaxID=381761 RepID=A0AAW1RCX3_9CHLO
MGAKAREVVVVLLHLAFWSQLGVLTRVYLDALFQGGCSGTFGVCLTSTGSRRGSLGAYFTDLPPNMLGSFLMGLLAASSTLGLNTGKMLAILPAHHAWQGMPELHIGLRTGFCGSLTTFASWAYTQLLQLIGGQGWDGGQWAEMLWGLVIGLQLSLASYVFGEHCALIIDRYCVAGGAAETEPKAMLETLAESMEAADEGRLGQPRSSQDPELAQLGAQLAERGEVVLPLADIARRHAAQCDVNTEQRGALAALAHRLRAAADHRKAAVAPFLAEDPGRYVLHRRSNLAVAAGLAALTALWVVLAVVDDHPDQAARRAQWFAMLLGPFGCMLRWLLSRLNYRLPGSWRWLPAGTLAANMLGCLTDFIVGVIAVRVGVLGYWPLVVMYAVRTGFAGALSTVSTYVAETHAQLKLVPESLHGYEYSFGSLLAGLLLGVVVYGPAVWAH